MKLCTDCRHYRARGYAGALSGALSGVMSNACARPLSDRIDPVHGWEADTLSARPEAERKPGRTLFSRRLRCGPDAIYFERADTLIWPAFRRALRQGLTDHQIEVAMTAALAESDRHIGSMDHSRAIGAIVGAAFAAVSVEMQNSNREIDDWSASLNTNWSTMAKPP